METTYASKEAVWLQRLCSDIGLVQQVVRLDCDIQSAIFLGKNQAYHLNTKHIDVQYHFVRDMVEEKKVLLEKVDTLKNVADSLTKSVSTEKFSWCRVTMGIVALDSLLYNPMDPWMQRKQQVGECWVCVIFFVCVCVGASDSKTASDDPSSSSLCIVCARHFQRGGGGGGEVVCPPLVMRNIRGNAPIFFLGGFCYF
jgi:hypothetical protein